MDFFTIKELRRELARRLIEKSYAEKLRRARRAQDDDWGSDWGSGWGQIGQHSYRQEDSFEKRVGKLLVGQDPAVSLVATNIRKKETGWMRDDHPLVFLFLGPSGSGKTELAKQIANYLHEDNKDAFIRIDMSEYQESHSMCRFIGPPPGYKEHDKGGQLTGALKKHKDAVVLFDEVEKAHPEVLTVLLQLFDEGRLTDSKNNTIECKDAIFIMTSNLANEAIVARAMHSRAEQRTDEEITNLREFTDPVRRILVAHLKRNELLGRIKVTVYFLPFSGAALKQLVIRELEFWANRAQVKNNLELTWDEQVIDVVLEGYEIHYGARSIMNEVDKKIITPISELHRSFKNAERVHISAGDEDNGSRISIEIT